MGGVIGERSCCPFTHANTAAFDFGNSVYWAGQGQVVNESGVYNPTFNIASSSGFDYSSAFVPEPSTGGLLSFVIGAATVIGRIRRRRKSV